MPSNLMDWVYGEADYNSNLPSLNNSFKVKALINPADGSQLVESLWYVKSITLPKLTFESKNSLLDGNSFLGDAFSFKQKNHLSFETIDVTLYNVPIAVTSQNIQFTSTEANNTPENVTDNLTTSGLLLSLYNNYTFPKNEAELVGYYATENFDRNYGSVLGGNFSGDNISQYNLEKRSFQKLTIECLVDQELLTEKFELLYPKIIKLDFGSKDYGSDDFSEVKATIEYISFRYYYKAPLEGVNAVNYIEDPFMRDISNHILNRYKSLNNVTDVFTDQFYKSLGVSSRLGSAPLSQGDTIGLTPFNLVEASQLYSTSAPSLPLQNRVSTDRDRPK